MLSIDIKKSETFYFLPDKWVMAKRLTAEGAEDRRGLLFFSAYLCGFLDHTRK
jgi:hypothetical protein